MSKYTDTEQDAFVRIRATMIDWKDSTIRFASVVAEAKEREIWKVKKYDTFEDFCQIECGITRQWANKLVLANKVMLQIATFEPSKPLQINKNLETAVSKPGVSIDAALELAKVPSSNRQTVLQQATATGQPLTAKSIAQAADQTLSKSKAKEEPVLDDIGIQIPGDALPFWGRRQEIQDMLNQVSRLKCAVEKAKTEGDPMFGKVSNTLISDLTSAYTHLLEAKPYAVCTSCSGFVSAQPKGCAFCGNKGLISKWQWDTQAKKEVKEIRLKSAAMKQ